MPDVPLRYGHYRVLQRADGTPWRLGMGAMGETFKAKDERLGIEVALKLILPTRVADARIQALFLREARAAARVRHAHVASVMFLGDTPGQLFYAMEYVPGDSLQKFLAKRGRLPPALAWSLATQIAQGLGAIHAEGLVHRDLKPANIMLVPTKAAGIALAEADRWQVKIIDFGLARAFDAGPRDDPTIAHTTGFRGTVLYASPEQCQEMTDLDGRSDLYALGCIVWEMLLGAPPFRARTQREIMNQHVGRPAPLEELSGMIEVVPKVLARLLAKDREDRFPTAAAAAVALQEARRACEAAEPEESVIMAAPSPVREPAPAPPASTATARPPESTVTPLAPPRRGLVWVAALALLGAGGGSFWLLRGPSGTTGGASFQAHTATEKSVAVLPFESLGDDRQSEFFSSGVQDEILTDLARAADLKVISRSSVRQFSAGAPRNLPELGRLLGVSYVLEGSVRCVGDRVRVLVQLIDTRSNGGKARWAERYDRKLADVFAIQSEIAAAVAAQLKVILTPEEKAAMAVRPTTELRAWELHLMAKELVFSGANGRGAEGTRRLREAETLLGEALTRDPKFFHAHCLLAYVHDSLYWFGADSSPQRLALAQASLDRAAELRPDAGELHLARAFHHYRAARDYPRAAQEIARANALLPNDRLAFSLRGYIDRRQGRFTDAIANLERAAALDPRETVPAYDLAESYAASRRAADFFRVMDRLSELSPEEQRIPVYRTYGGDLMLRGEPGPLRTLLRGYQRDRPQQFTEFAAHAFALALLTRDVEGAAEATNAIREEFTVWNRRRFPKRYFDGVRHHFFGARVDAQAAFAEAQGQLERRLQQVPDDDRAAMALAFVQAYRGRKDEALATARRVTEQMPLAADAIDGAYHAAGWIEILALVGENERAFAELDRLVERPFVLDYGDLLLSPVWDGLRKDPRFGALVERARAR